MSNEKSIIPKKPVKNIGRLFLGAGKGSLKYLMDNFTLGTFSGAVDEVKGHSFDKKLKNFKEDVNKYIMTTSELLLNNVNLLESLIDINVPEEKIKPIENF